MDAALTLAAIGANALWLLYLWLASAIVCAELSRRKGYGERLGLGTGLLLSAVGVIVWLIVRPKPESPWAQRRARARSAAG
jgi:hypothetical protein